MQCRKGRNYEDCRCHHPGQGALLQGFIQPTLLLLLLEEPSHGYELTRRLSELGQADADPGGIYRNLQKLEADNFIESTCDTTGSGPARKVYRVTPEGRDFLDTWVGALTRNQDLIQAFIDRYSQIRRRMAGDEE